VVAASLRVRSDAARDRPDLLGKVDTFCLAATITDTSSGASEEQRFTGTLGGSVSKAHSDVTIEWQGSTEVAFILAAPPP
jgi:hypothetical protein